MIVRNLGDLGIYQVTQNDILTLKTPGRKYSAKKDSRTRLPQEFLLNDLVDTRHVRVGDIVDVSDYRRTHSYIVSLNPQKKLMLVPLETTSSGYGIIPVAVSSFFKNAIDAFGQKVDVHTIELSPTDKGLKEYFFKGKTVPRAYAYEYTTVTDTVDVFDPVSERTITMDRSGRMPASYLRKMFKTVPTQVLKFNVSFAFNPQRKQHINKLWAQVQQGKRTEEQYREAKLAHYHPWKAFRDTKKKQMENIFIKNHIKTEFAGGRGGSFQTTSRYTAEGTKTALAKARTALLKLNETTPDGSVRIQLL